MPMIQQACCLAKYVQLVQMGSYDSKVCPVEESRRILYSAFLIVLSGNKKNNLGVTFMNKIHRCTRI